MKSLILPIIIGLITIIVLFILVMVVSGFASSYIERNNLVLIYLFGLAVSLMAGGYITATQIKTSYFIRKLIMCCVVGFMGVGAASILFNTSGVLWLKVIFSIAGAGLSALGGAITYLKPTNKRSQSD